MENSHLLRKVFVVFDEFLGFKTKSGWTKRFDKAKIFSQKHHIFQTYDLKKELEKSDTTVRIVPIQMMLDESDYVALRLGGYLE